MGLFSFGSALIGLDIGASSVKVISGKLHKNVFVADALAIVPLRNKSFDDRGVIEASVVAAAIASAFEQIGKKSPAVATALRGSGVLTKRILISHFPKKEIPDQVRWEAEQVFPTDISTIFIDHVLIGETQNLPGAPAGTKGWEILLVGVRQDTAVTLRSTIEATGSKVKVLDLDAFVLSDFLESALGITRDKVIAFVDVGASATRICVRHRGHVIFIREFLIGGNTFTEAIAQALGLSFEDAESVKIQDGTGIPQEAQEAMRAVLVNWKSEVQQCEDVFVTQDSNLMIGNWILFGGGSLTPGLFDLLRDEHFGEKVIPLAASNLFRAKGTVDANVLQAWAPRLITAAGLACRKSSG